jgi:CheY-like chemotaxis protein
MQELGWPVGRAQGVLVADDDGVFRDIIQRALQKSGYRVLVAEDGSTALACYYACMSMIDLVLTDISMPGLDGDELGARVRASTAGLPVIYMSGRCRSELLEERRLSATDVYLQKPFTRDCLLRQIQGLLGVSVPPSAAAQRVAASSAMPSARNK